MTGNEHIDKMIEIIQHNDVLNEIPKITMLYISKDLAKQQARIRIKEWEQMHESYFDREELADEALIRIEYWKMKLDEINKTDLPI